MLAVRSALPNLLEQMHEWRKQHGDIFTLRLGSKLMVVISSYKVKYMVFIMIITCYKVNYKVFTIVIIRSHKVNYNVFTMVIIRAGAG